jgi:hypothetical protein
MRTQESLLTLLALGIGLCLTLALIFANFTVVLSLKLIQTGQINLASYTLMLLITAITTGLPIWLLSVHKRGRIPDKSPNAQAKPSFYQERQRHMSLLLELAQTRTSFTVQEVQRTTGLDRLAAGYLLDDCIHAGHIRAEQQEDGFVYRLARE